MDVDGAAEQRSLRVRDLWRNGTGWAFDRILPYVPQNTRLELSAIVLDNVTGAKDRLAWGETANGAFTVKSAYSLLTTYSGPKPNMSSFYDRIWQVIVPERVRMFLWLVGRQVIMTNVERERRHLGDTRVCPVCRGGDETIFHVLRNCPSIAGIWRRIVPVQRQQWFWNATVLEWIYGNLQHWSGEQDGSWSTLFGMGVWWGWK